MEVDCLTIDNFGINSGNLAGRKIIQTDQLRSYGSKLFRKNDICEPRIALYSKMKKILREALDLLEGKSKYPP